MEHAGAGTIEMGDMSSTTNESKATGASPLEPTQAGSGAWSERLRALKNVPLVLGILWQAGRSIVVWGLILRVVQPAVSLGIGIVAAEIVYGVTKAIERQSPLAHFWWWVGAEVALALFSGFLPAPWITPTRFSPTAIPTT